MNGVAAWTALETKYRHGRTYGMGAYANELYSRRITGDPESWITQTEFCATRLHTLLGDPVPDGMLVSAGMGALSGPYKELTTNLAFQEGLTFEGFKARVREFYSRNKYDGVFAKG